MIVKKSNTIVIQHEVTLLAKYQHHLPHCQASILLYINHVHLSRSKLGSKMGSKMNAFFILRLDWCPCLNVLPTFLTMIVAVQASIQWHRQGQEPYQQYMVDCNPFQLVSPTFEFPLVIVSTLAQLSCVLENQEGLVTRI